MSKQPNYSMDRQNRDRAKQAKKAAKAQEKAAAKHEGVPQHGAPTAPDKPSSTVDGTTKAAGVEPAAENGGEPGGLLGEPASAP